MEEEFLMKKEAYCSLSNCKSSDEKDLILINSKKHLAVASTSAVALCASAKTSLNKNSFNSVSVGSLNLPPLPPLSLHSSAVFSEQVSRTGFFTNSFSTENL